MPSYLPPATAKQTKMLTETPVVETLYSLTKTQIRMIVVILEYFLIVTALEVAGVASKIFDKKRNALFQFIQFMSIF